MKRSIRFATRFALLPAIAVLCLSADSASRPYQGELRTSRYVYTGSISGGKQHGFGICRYTNGNIYTGYWNKGYKEGLGRIEFADGSMDFGIWRQGILEAPKGRRFSVGKRCYGIDVSKYQKRIDWTNLALKARADGTISATGKNMKYLQPVLFALIKSTEGVTVKDPYFDRNFAGAKAAGIIRGAYHYLSITSPVEKQVEFFIENTPLEKGDFPPVLDLEISKKTMKEHHAKVCEMALKWLKAVEKHYGVKPVVYTYENYYKDYLKGRGFDEYDFWIARYGAEPSARRWEIWQLTDKCFCSGMNHKVDLDRFRGSYSELKEYLKNKGIQ